MPIFNCRCNVIVYLPQIVTKCVAVRLALIWMLSLVRSSRKQEHYKKSRRARKKRKKYAKYIKFSSMEYCPSNNFFTFTILDFSINLRS